MNKWLLIKKIHERKIDYMRFCDYIQLCFINTIKSFTIPHQILHILIVLAQCVTQCVIISIMAQITYVLEHLKEKIFILHFNVNENPSFLRRIQNLVIFNFIS